VIEYIIYFLALLNPFALFVYTLPLKKEFGIGRYIKIMTFASLISASIYLLFALSGTYLFEHVLKIRFDSLRIFGGVVLLAFALSYIVQGKESFITIKGKLSKIASEVALPFMVGAGTIALSVVIGGEFSALGTILTIIMVMIANLAIVACLAFVRHKLVDRFKTVFDENIEIILRLNGFIVGAFGVDLIITGIQNITA